MTDNFEILMPAHRLVILQAEEMVNASSDGEEYLAKLKLKIAMNILDLGKHGMAQQILDARKWPYGLARLETRSGPFPTLPPSEDGGWQPGIECEHGYDACPICDAQPEEPKISDVGRESLAKEFRR
jgi:hypothetical protein